MLLAVAPTKRARPLWARLFSRSDSLWWLLSGLLREPSLRSCVGGERPVGYGSRTALVASGGCSTAIGSAILAPLTHLAGAWFFHELSIDQSEVALRDHQVIVPENGPSDRHPLDIIPLTMQPA